MKGTEEGELLTSVTTVASLATFLNASLPVLELKPTPTHVDVAATITQPSIKDAV